MRGLESLVRLPGVTLADSASVELGLDARRLEEGVVELRQQSGDDNPIVDLFGNNLTNNFPRRDTGATELGHKGQRTEATESGTQNRGRAQRLGRCATHYPEGAAGSLVGDGPQFV